jgi:hypothetical protein
MPHHNPTEPQGDVFEGANHVLHGIMTQLDYWDGLSGHDAQKQEMLPALTAAAETLRNALQNAKARQGALGTQAGAR